MGGVEWYSASWNAVGSHSKTGQGVWGSGW